MFRRIQLFGKMYEGTLGDIVGIRPGNKGIGLVRPYKGRTVEFCLCVVRIPVRCNSSVWCVSLVCCEDLLSG
jgi:hypothetical protein